MCVRYRYVCGVCVCEIPVCVQGVCVCVRCKCVLTVLQDCGRTGASSAGRRSCTGRVCGNTGSDTATCATTRATCAARPSR